MGSPKAEGSSPSVIGELTKGRQSAATLATLLLLDSPDSPTRILLEEIMSTISKAIAVLESGRSQDHMEAQVDSPSSDVTSKAPREKRKIQSTRKAANRQRRNPYSWTRVTSATIEDGHAWRKYGQKEIFSAKHPRSYYRCTYKYDRGCMATKQVQKSEDDPFIYVITYSGEHICKGAKEGMSRCREPHVFSFESNMVNSIKPEIPISSFQSRKKENEEEVVSNLSSSDSPSDWFEPLEMELQKPSKIRLEPDWSNSSPGLNSSITSYDLELMNLEDILSFDQNELFTW